MALWNAMYKLFPTRQQRYEERQDPEHRYWTSMWSSFFRRSLRTIPRYISEITSELETIFLDGDWHMPFDYIELHLEWVATCRDTTAVTYNTELLNTTLQNACSGYRIIEHKLVPITQDSERIAVQDALSTSFAFLQESRQHLQAASKLLFDRKSPDLRNAAKESISAVESAAREITQQPGATLGPLLQVLEQRKRIHPALKAAYTAIYGYSSDADGIRHSLKSGESGPTPAETRWLFMTCVAFINYLTESHTE